MDWVARIWGYTGAGGMVQAFSAEYFLWDLMVSIVHLDVSGWSSLIHAICALVMVGFGFVSYSFVTTLFKYLLISSTSKYYTNLANTQKIFRKLIWSKLRTLRTFHTIFQYALVFWQAQYGEFQSPALQLHHSSVHVILVWSLMGCLPICKGLLRYMDLLSNPNHNNCRLWLRVP